jgi:hypothetical protein
MTDINLTTPETFHDCKPTHAARPVDLEAARLAMVAAWEGGADNLAECQQAELDAAAAEAFYRALSDMQQAGMDETAIAIQIGTLFSVSL